MMKQKEELELEQRIEEAAEAKVKAPPVTEIFDNFTVDNTKKEDAFLQMLLKKKQQQSQPEAAGLPPMSLMTELKSKLQERKVAVIDQEPVKFKVFDTSKERFVETTKELRAKQEAEHEQKLREIKQQEREEKQRMEQMV